MNSISNLSTGQKIALFAGIFVMLACLCCGGFLMLGALTSNGSPSSASLNPARTETSPAVIVPTVAGSTPLATQADAVTPIPAATSIPAATAAPQATQASQARIAVLAIEDPSTPGSLYEAKAGKHLVGVDVVIENNSGGPISINPLYATLLDSTGLTYTAELGASDLHRQMATMDILPGERVEGWIFFSVQDGASPAQVKYISGLIGSELGRGDITAAGRVDWPTAAAPAQTPVSQGYSLKVDQVVDPATPDTTFYTPTAGTHLVAIQFTVRNESGAEPLSVNPLYAYMIDDHGFVHWAELAATNLEQISTMKLGQGEAAQGYVSFELPDGYKPVALRFSIDSFRTTTGMTVLLAP